MGGSLQLPVASAPPTAAAETQPVNSGSSAPPPAADVTTETVNTGSEAAEGTVVTRTSANEAVIREICSKSFKNFQEFAKEVKHVKKFNTAESSLNNPHFQPIFGSIAKHLYFKNMESGTKKNLNAIKLAIKTQVETFKIDETEFIELFKAPFHLLYLLYCYPNQDNGGTKFKVADIVLYYKWYKLEYKGSDETFATLRTQMKTATQGIGKHFENFTAAVYNKKITKRQGKNDGIKTIRSPAELKKTSDRDLFSNEEVRFIFAVKGPMSVKVKRLFQQEDDKLDEEEVELDDEEKEVELDDDEEEEEDSFKTSKKARMSTGEIKNKSVIASVSPVKPTHVIRLSRTAKNVNDYSTMKRNL